MNPRPSSQSAIPNPEFGLLSWLEETRVVLPLKAIDCRFEVCGSVAHVGIDQVFHQQNAEALDCTYTFPLPGNAAAYRCEIEVNQRLIVAKTMKRALAIHLAAEKKAEGKRVAVASAERENLFTLELANVQPDDLVIVRFAYFQSLDRIGDLLSLQVPFCPGVRYVPGTPLIRSNRGQGTSDDTSEVPDASLISPPRIDRYHPDAAILRIAGSVTTAATGFVSLSSPTHPVLVEVREPNSAKVSLAHHGDVPDRDFILRWQEERPVGGPRSRAWQVRGSDGYSYAQAELVAPADVEIAKETEGQDLYFLLDRSGSMSGAKWQKTCEAFLCALRLLRPMDRAWATLFENECCDIAEAPLSPDLLLADRGVLNVSQVGTAGGTNMLPALSHVLAAMKKFTPEGREGVLILITDAQVGNEDAILEALRHERIKIHTFGIDTAVNDSLLRNLAELHGGSCILMTPNDDIAAAVSTLGDRLRRPVLTNLSSDDEWELPDARVVPSLLAGSTVTLLARAASNGAEHFVVYGQTSSGAKQRISIPLEATDSPALKTLWVKSRIARLQRSGNEDDREASFALACQYNILAKGISFVAWDEDEKVGVASRWLYQAAQAVLADQEKHVMYDGRLPRVPMLSACSRIPRQRSLSRLAEVALSPSIGQPLDRAGTSIPAKLHERKDYLKSLQPDDEGRTVDRESILKDCPTLDLDDILGPGNCNITRKRLRELAPLIDWNASGATAGHGLIRFFAGLILWGGENQGDMLVRNLKEALEMPSLGPTLREAAKLVARNTIAVAYCQLGQQSIPGITPRIASAFVHFLWTTAYSDDANAGGEGPSSRIKISPNRKIVMAELIVPQIIDLRAMGGVRRCGGDAALWSNFIGFRSGDALYLDYCKCLGKWARELGCSAEQLEYFLRS